jgi:hypothetical protein
MNFLAGAYDGDGSLSGISLCKNGKEAFRYMFKKCGINIAFTGDSAIVKSDSLTLFRDKILKLTHLNYRTHKATSFIKSRQKQLRRKGNGYLIPSSIQKLYRQAMSVTNFRTYLDCIKFRKQFSWIPNFSNPLFSRNVNLLSEIKKLVTADCSSMIDTTSVEKLKMLVNADIEFCYIRKIEKSAVEIVYDIQTDDGTYLLNSVMSHNSANFDIPYLRARMKAHRLYCNFDDINHLDLMKVFMKSYAIQKKLGELSVRSYSLDSMSKIFVGDSKLETEAGSGYGGKLWNLFLNDRETLLKYNLQDCVLMKKLNEKLNFLTNQIELSKLAKVNLEDTTYQSRMIDMYILRRARTMNIHFKSIVRGLEKAHYEGGICELSNPGLYENVAIFDATSMYPNLILSFNISTESILSDDYEGDCYTTFNGVKYSRIKGVIPMIIEDLINYRYRLRDEQDRCEKGSEEWSKAEIKQVVVKILINSFYGCLGSNFTRYFSLKLATSITTNGQEMMRKIISFVGTTNYAKWVYSDTDAIYVALNSLDNVDRFKFELKDYVDKIVQEKTGFPNKYMSFKLEKVFSRFVIVAKKKYFGKVVAE